MKLILLTIVFFVTSCSNFDNKSYLSSQNDINDKKKVQTKKYVGWWIFGENIHLFKDSKNLEEYELFFSMKQVKKLLNFTWKLQSKSFYQLI